MFFILIGPFMHTEQLGWLATAPG